MTISGGVAEVVVVPSLGAGLAACDHAVAGGHFAVFRRAAPANITPYGLASLLMLPATLRPRVTTGS